MPILSSSASTAGNAVSRSSSWDTSNAAHRLETIAAKHPGLHMVGNSYYGVGLNDCVKMAHRIAGKITAPE